MKRAGAPCAPAFTTSPTNAVTTEGSTAGATTAQAPVAEQLAAPCAGAEGAAIEGPPGIVAAQGSVAACSRMHASDPGSHCSWLSSTITATKDRMIWRGCLPPSHEPFQKSG